MLLLGYFLSFSKAHSPPLIDFVSVQIHYSHPLDHMSKPLRVCITKSHPGGPKRGQMLDHMLFFFPCGRTLC